MIETPMDVLHQFPVRKSKKQKQAFRDAIQSYAERLGYQVKIEKGSMGCRNVVIGDPERADYLISAHYDTCAAMLLPNLVTPRNFLVFVLYQLFLAAVFLGAYLVLTALAGGVAMAYGADSDWASLAILMIYFLLLKLMFWGPANRHNANDNTSGVVAVLETARSMPQAYRNRVCFVLFDLEELGLIGSASHRKKHRAATNRQMAVNLDCVGDGDEIWLLPNKKLRKDQKKLWKLLSLRGTWGKKSVHVHQKGFAMYPSDQANFPLGVGVGAFHRSKWVGIYYGRIHTFRDTILDHTNINILRAVLVTLVTRSSGDHNHQEDTEYETL